MQHLSQRSRQRLDTKNARSVDKKCSELKGKLRVCMIFICDKCNCTVVLPEVKTEEGKTAVRCGVEWS